MKKDINPPKVENVGIAVVPEKNELDQTEWTVYLINLLEHNIEGVLVTSKGYGENQGRKVETTQLRHFLDVVNGQGFQKIEPIMEDVFGLSNEYWVSYFYNGQLYDKKFVFVPGSLSEENMTMISVMHKKGILILT